MLLFIISDEETKVYIRHKETPLRVYCFCHNRNRINFVKTKLKSNAVNVLVEKCNYPQNIIGH